MRKYFFRFCSPFRRPLLYSSPYATPPLVLKRGLGEILGSLVARTQEPCCFVLLTARGFLGS
jgi:hypothetical protein